MKANQFATDDDAQVGIGTMIVFIATVLVAAVAAGVLINVGGDLQSQSKATGAEAQNEVANSLTLKRVYARDVITTGATSEEADTDGDDNVADEFHMYVSLAAGARSVDMSAAEVILDTGDAILTMQYVDISGAVGAPAAGSYFTLERNGAPSANPDITAGELVNVRLLGTTSGADAWTTRLNVEPGSEVGITISLPTGSPLFGTFTLPDVMDEDYEQLY